MSRRTAWAGILAAATAVAGCALKSDVRRVETELALMKLEAAQRDSVAARRLAEIIAVQQRILDSLRGTDRRLTAVRGELSGEHFTIQQLLVQVQELTGQSQQRLSELRAQLEAERQTDRAPVAGDTGAGPVARDPSAEQMYQASLQQLRRGSLTTARLGFRQLIQSHPSSERVPDALYFIGESFAAEPDSARAHYVQVVQGHANSSRAPAALYKLGLLAEQRQQPDEARNLYRRVVDDYATSDAASLARDRLRALGQ